MVELTRTIEEAKNGTQFIKIDGVDIGNVGLHFLRSNISLIPQVPVIFIGTIRYNIDPLNQYSD